MRPPTSRKRWLASGRAPNVPDPALAIGLDQARFAALILPLGPFETGPRLAVAVSGGPDSLALCLLADRWTRVQGGEVVGLIVDHGLRPESAAEARQTAAWLAARRIGSQILTWSGAKPAVGIQAAARDARYRLLADWCRIAGVLHLLIAHHQDDQAETVVLREARASGPDGLAGMAAVRELPGLRLLRPLLSVPKAALIAWLEAEGQPWLDDPSNRSPGFARTRLRAKPHPEAARVETARLVRLAYAQGAARAALDTAVAAWLVQHVRLWPHGFVLMAPAALAAAPAAIARRALEQTLLTVGGRRYPPRRARLDRLLEELRAGPHRFAGRTLGGCQLRRQAERLLVCREAEAVEQVLAPAPGYGQSWDGRFAIDASGELDGLSVRALGATGWRQRAGLQRTTSALPAPCLPPVVGPSLPAVWRDDRLVAVPSLGLIVPDCAGRFMISARFRPRHPLAGAPFAAGPAPDAVA
jgi:tRNA(Ile)-lysidine synthase